jgi:hypothetical protein
VSDDIVISPDRPLRMTANCMRALTKATGRTFTALMGDDDDEGNRIQVMAFTALWSRADRLGHLPDPATLWEEAGDEIVVFAAPERLDPLGDGSSTTSPPSAAIGA